MVRTTWYAAERSQAGIAVNKQAKQALQFDQQRELQAFVCSGGLTEATLGRRKTSGRHKITEWQNHGAIKIVDVKRACAHARACLAPRVCARQPHPLPPPSATRTRPLAPAPAGVR